MSDENNLAVRVLRDISRTRTIDQLVRISRSPQVQALGGSDAEAVAAAVSGRLLAVEIDYDQPVPRGGA
jgi:hypothetical protein